MTTSQTIAAVSCLMLGLTALGQPPRSAPTSDAPHWSVAEEGSLKHHVQLTSPDQFLKAGESYFSPDDSMIVFQAIEADAEETPGDFYGMYVADVVRDPSGRITGIDNIRRLSPPGSSNTCGWFHPTDPNIVLFASTIGRPSESTTPGYQRGTGRYRWMFPPEMNIVQVNLDEADGTSASLEVLVANNDAYLAECSFSPDARHLLYCSLETGEGDLYVKDLKTGNVVQLVSARGYDGGPFFSPDGRRITYRADRRGNNLLQIYIGELAFNQDGAIVGLEREFQLTDNAHVNWAPYWHPEGRHLVYATSEVGHHNYEVYIIDADAGDAEASTGTTKYGTRKRRVTHAPGFDGLPVFDSIGTVMMWTSQRGEDQSSQLWVAEFEVPLDPAPQVRPYGRPRSSDNSSRSSGGERDDASDQP